MFILTIFILFFIYPISYGSVDLSLSSDALSTIPVQVPRVNNLRKPSFPYMSPDTFRFICEHKYDEVPESILNPSLVKRGDAVYVNPAFLMDFFEKVHPQISNSYILVSVGHDNSTPGEFEFMLDDKKLYHWFGANGSKTEHSKFTHIPIGISNSYWPHGDIDVLTNLMKSVKAGALDKKFLLGLNFTVATNPKVRQPLLDHFKSFKYCKSFKATGFYEYLVNMANCKFIISPHGNGLDCHRTWEALWVGSYPVVKRSALDCMYRDLPVVVVDDWEEVNEVFLKNKYSLLRKKRFNYKKLYFDFYNKQIDFAKKWCRES